MGNQQFPHITPQEYYMGEVTGKYNGGPNKTSGILSCFYHRIYRNMGEVGEQDQKYTRQTQYALH